MNTVSSVGSATEGRATSKPPLSAAFTTRGTIRSAPCHVQLDAAVDLARAGHALDLAREVLGERPRRSPLAFTVTIVSAPTERLSAAGRVEREDLAVVHDRDPVAELVRLLHVVRREQDRLARGVQLAEDLPQREPALRVEPGGRLVHEQHGGPVEDRARDHQPLGHPARKGEHRRLAPTSRDGTARAARRRSRATPAEMPKSRPWK